MTFDQLKRITEAATPGPWKTENHYGISIVVGPEGDLTHAIEHETDARFIATFNPETVKKLLAVVEAANRLHPQDFYAAETLKKALVALSTD